MNRPRQPLVIAHRGASGHRPENTLPAYALAVEQGCDMIEIDLHTTRDGEIVITHDAELVDIGGRGEVATASVAEIRALDAGAGEPVPLLDEVLDQFGRVVPFNLELKQGTAGAYAGMEAATAEAVQDRGLEPQTLYSSFYDPVLANLRHAAPDARIALLISRKFPERIFERAEAVGAEAVNPELPVVDAALVEEAHARGLAVYVFTVDAPDEMKRLLDLGVDGLFTNFPDRMRAIVDERS